MELKDPSKSHFYLSLVKSAIRIVGCILAIQFTSVELLALFFAGAELIGIAEEI